MLSDLAGVGAIPTRSDTVKAALNVKRCNGDDDDVRRVTCTMWERHNPAVEKKQGVVLCAGVCSRTKGLIFNLLQDLLRDTALN